MEYTCSNCHFVCHPVSGFPDFFVRMLTESGVVIQEPDGTLRAVSPEEAKEYFKNMPLERRKLYESVPEE